MGEDAHDGLELHLRFLGMRRPKENHSTIIGANVTSIVDTRNLLLKRQPTTRDSAQVTISEMRLRYLGRLVQ